MPKKSTLVALKLRWSGPVLVCRKCLGRVENGAKLKRRLKAQLKQNYPLQKKRRPRLVLTDCFGICPKDAVVAASAETLARGDVLLIYEASADSIEQAAAALIAEQAD